MNSPYPAQSAPTASGPAGSQQGLAGLSRSLALELGGGRAFRESHAVSTPDTAGRWAGRWAGAWGSLPGAPRSWGSLSWRRAAGAVGWVLWDGCCGVLLSRQQKAGEDKAAPEPRHFHGNCLQVCDCHLTWGSRGGL